MEELTRSVISRYNVNDRTKFKIKANDLGAINKGINKRFKAKAKPSTKGPVASD